MLAILDAVKLAAEYFEKKGIESPRTNAELLLCDLLNCKKMDLYLKFDQPLKDFEVDKYREYIARRGKFEPLQYITGWTEFYGLKFHVNESVLIPRPETEILVETIIEHNKNKTQLSILDIGTGSGNIAVALAKFLPQSQIISIDISDVALITAKKNSDLNNTSDKIDFLKADIFEEFHLSKYSFDIIVSNPPYVDSSEYLNLQKEITEYEPQIAVTDGSDGLKYYRRIINMCGNILNENGVVYFEIGKGQAGEIISIMEMGGLNNIGCVKDYQQIERVLYGIKL